MSAGLDSLGAVELRKELSTLTSLELPATLVFDHPSADSIAQLIAGQLAPQMQGAGPTLPCSAPTPENYSSKVCVRRSRLLRSAAQACLTHHEEA